jgi:hypothetical protein
MIFIIFCKLIKMHGIFSLVKKKMILEINN